LERKNLLKYLRVSVNTDCNKECWYCFSEGIHTKKREMMDVDAFRWVIELLKRYFGIINVRFTGGEPLLNDKLALFIKETKKVGVNNIGVTTNGTLLPQKYNELIDAGVDNFAIHVTDIDCDDWNVNELRISFSKARYNVVVTKSNYQRVLEFIDFANERRLNILLLDLLENSNIKKEVYAKEYLSLNLLYEKIQNLGYTKFEQGDNCIVFSSTSNDIKLVKRYIDFDGERYCTKKLEMHPILLTSDFNIRLCNHFGTKELEIKNFIEQRDSAKFIEKVDDILLELEACDDCSSKIILV